MHLTLDDRKEAIKEFTHFLEVLDETGIHTTTFTFEPDGVWSTDPSITRGGAKARAVDASDLAKKTYTHGRRFSEEEIWNNFTYFIDHVIPSAEKAGVPD